MRCSVTHQRISISDSSGVGSFRCCQVGASCSNESAASVDGFEDDHIFRVDSSNFECGSFSSRCSFKLINDVVSNLDQNKRELVSSTGFGGLLHFPPMKQINRKFALWLMSCVDESSRTLVVGDHIRIRFCKEDVGCVLGIPSSGKAVIDHRYTNRAAKDKVLDEYLGENFKKQRSIKELVDVILRDYDQPMSKFDRDRFRIAFVVFVSSTLLSPASKHDYACIDYWSAIADADLIGSFDWTEFVLFRLLEAVSKLKQDISSSVKFPNITGCSVFLQVLYLDSVDLGELSICEKSLPRIRHFCFEKIRDMIAADQNYLNYLNGIQEGRVTELRGCSSCCYYWAFEALVPSDAARPVSLLAIWESCVAMARFMDIPMEAAGPLFVAAAEFQDQVDAGVARSGIHAIKYLTVLVSIMSAYKEGFTYHVSVGDDHVSGNLNISEELSGVVAGGLRMLSEPVSRKRKQSPVTPLPSSNGLVQNLHRSIIGDSVHSSIKLAIQSLQVMRLELNVNHRLICSMSNFYSLVSRMKLPADFDMNETPLQYYRCSHGPSLSVPHNLREVPNPWSLGYYWSLAQVDTLDVFSRVTSVRDEEGFVIVHRNPRHIQVTARAFRMQILGISELELDLFDAIVRKVKQEDADLYKDVSCVRWRHFFESDFMATITCGSFDLADSRLMHHFLASNIIYDISACKVLIFPALLQFRWVCYAWCLDVNVIHVFDPSYSETAPESIIYCHERICYLLKSAMHSLTRSLLEHWKHNWIDADLRMVTWVDKTVKGFNRSGVLAALFCCCFDGQEITPTPLSVDTNAIAARLTHDIVGLKGNIGKIPVVLM